MGERDRLDGSQWHQSSAGLYRPGSPVARGTTSFSTSLLLHRCVAFLCVFYCFNLILCVKLIH
ncbi:hypothetical protein LDENG_00155960 [Lucifuga dentata]|nr:hypothetical protein LDENG_00155960 [Lucifuga dentata]